MGSYNQSQPSYGGGQGAKSQQPRQPFYGGGAGAKNSYAQQPDYGNDMQFQRRSWTPSGGAPTGYGQAPATGNSSQEMPQIGRQFMRNNQMYRTVRPPNSYGNPTIGAGGPPPNQGETNQNPWANRGVIGTGGVTRYTDAQGQILTNGAGNGYQQAEDGSILTTTPDGRVMAGNNVWGSIGANGQITRAQQVNPYLNRSIIGTGGATRQVDAQGRILTGGPGGGFQQAEDGSILTTTADGRVMAGNNVWGSIGQDGRITRAQQNPAYGNAPNSGGNVWDYTDPNAYVRNNNVQFDQSGVGNGVINLLQRYNQAGLANRPGYGMDMNGNIASLDQLQGQLWNPNSGQNYAWVNGENSMRRARGL